MKIFWGLNFGGGGGGGGGVEKSVRSRGVG